ncbi:MAG: zinc ABC transporter substrate-binding protein, partial [Clostridiales bacterium]|nr:zinc ABC transporter substrate-binding protein [Clostridiales bacterium]
MKKLIGLLLAAVLLLAAALFLLGSCAAMGDSQRAGGAPRTGSIVVTDFPCYDLVRQVTGTAEGLTLLIRPGTDAHMYEPTPADAMALYSADVFVYIGGHGDAWADDILEATDGLTVVRLMDSVEALEEEHGHEEGEEHGHE